MDWAQDPQTGEWYMAEPDAMGQPQVVAQMPPAGHGSHMMPDGQMMAGSPMDTAPGPTAPPLGVHTPGPPRYDREGVDRSSDPLMSPIQPAVAPPLYDNMD
jgi:hypothetical protein